MVWNGENDFNADPFNLDQNASDLNYLSTPWKVIRFEVIWIENGLNIQVWTRSPMIKKT